MNIPGTRKHIKDASLEDRQAFIDKYFPTAKPPMFCWNGTEYGGFDINNWKVHDITNSLNKESTRSIAMYIIMSARAKLGYN